MRGLRYFRLHHLQLPRSHALQIMPRETPRATTDAGQVGQDRLARALSESVTAVAAIAPMLCEPDVKTTQVSQLLHGHIAEVVERQGLWLLVEGADGYPGWVHQGYVVTMPEPVPDLSRTGWDDPRPLSLGCTVRDEHGATRKLPLGALITEGQERFGGLAMTLEERRQSFPPAPDSITASAMMFFERMKELRPADLLFFSDETDGKITHVAISLGGMRVVHLALGRGGYAVDDLESGDESTDLLLKRFRFA